MSLWMLILILTTSISCIMCVECSYAFLGLFNYLAVKGPFVTQAMFSKLPGTIISPRPNELSEFLTDSIGTIEQHCYIISHVAYACCFLLLRSV